MRRKIITTVISVGMMLITSLVSTACNPATYEEAVSRVFDEVSELEQTGETGVDLSDVSDEVDTMDTEIGSAVIALPSSNQTTVDNRQEESTTMGESENAERPKDKEQSSVEETIVEEISTSYIPTTKEDVAVDKDVEVTTGEIIEDKEHESVRLPSEEEVTTVKDSSSEEVKVTGISIDKAYVTLNEGESQYITITVEPYNASNKYVMLNTSNSHVATIDAFGKITANGVGKATISIVTIDGHFEADCNVTVVSTEVAPTKISLNKTEIELNIGESTDLLVSVLPIEATKKYINYSSSNTSVATVSASGQIVARSAGDCIITVLSADSGAITSCKVTVSSPVESISLSKSALSLNKGESFTLVAAITPSNATDKDVTWSSSNISVAKVSPEGKVVAVGNGTTNITVRTKNGKTSTCVVTVSVPVTGVSIDGLSNIALDFNNEINKYYLCNAVVQPADATNKSITYTSSDTSVATVSNTGKVTALKRGVVTITATSTDGGYKDSITVYVYKSNASIPVGGNIWYRISLGSTTNRVLDVYNGDTYNGSKVQLWTSNGSNAQLWQFHNYISTNGGIAIVPKCNSGAFILDVNRGSSYSLPFKENNLIDLWTLGTDNAASMWEMVRMWDDGYILRLVNTEWVVGVTSTSTGAQLMLRKFDPFDMNQRWFLEPVEINDSMASQGIEKAINWAKDQMNAGNTSYSYWCLKFIGEAFRAGGINNAGYATATEAGDKLITSTDTNPPRGTVVFWDWYGTINGVYANYGHVGISLGNGYVIHADYNGIKITGLDLGGRTYRGWGEWK